MEFPKAVGRILTIKAEDAPDVSELERRPVGRTGKEGLWRTPKESPP